MNATLKKLALQKQSVSKKYTKMMDKADKFRGDLYCLGDAISEEMRKIVIKPSAIAAHHNEMRETADAHTAKYKGYFPYIPSIGVEGKHYNSEIIHSVLGMLARCKHIADVGCGYGEALAFMHSIAPKVKYTGIEVNPRYTTIANKYYGKDITFINSDAFEVKEQFATFDGIYTYVPVANSDLLTRFYSHIWEQIKVGTIWVEVASEGFINHLRRNNCSYEKIDRHTFRKTG